MLVCSLTLLQTHGGHNDNLRGTTSTTVQNLVTGEQDLPPSDYYSQASIISVSAAGEPVPTAIEQPMFDQIEAVGEPMHKDIMPTPTVEQRRFSAPQSEWDASR